MYFPYLDRIEASTYDEAKEKALQTFEQQYDYTVTTLNKVGLTFTQPFSVDAGTIVSKVDEGLWDVRMSMSLASDMTPKQLDAYNKFLMTLVEEN